MWWQILVGIIAAISIVWVGMIAVLWRVQRHQPVPSTFREALRLLPDVVRLMRRIATDHQIPRPVRVRVWLLLLYLISPIDLIPDFIPVLGYADDAIILGVALRSIARRAGLANLERHWPGTPEGLTTVLRLAGIRRPGLFDGCDQSARRDSPGPRSMFE